MFEVNEGKLDRGIRIVLGLVMMGVGFGGVIGGGLGTAVGVIGLVPLITGLAGRCPAYALLGMDTCSMRKAPR